MKKELRGFSRIKGFEQVVHHQENCNILLELASSTNLQENNLQHKEELTKLLFKEKASKRQPKPCLVCSAGPGFHCQDGSELFLEFNTYVHHILKI